MTSPSFPPLAGQELFDARFYRRLYHDVALEGIDPLEHWLREGKAQGRHPNAASLDFLDPAFYSNLYGGFCGDEPVKHYILEGRQNGFLANAAIRDFDPEFYLKQRPDVHHALADPLGHFIAIGREEARKKQIGPAISPRHGQKVLVADKRIIEFDRSAGERATWHIMLSFIKLGYDVYYLPWVVDKTEAKYIQAMLDVGIKPVLPADMAENWHKQWLRAHGAQMSLFFLARPEVAADFLPVIRESNHKAKIIYQAPDLSWLREGREARLNGNQALAQQAACDKHRELELMSRVDLNVLISDAEKNALLDEAPGLEAPIHVFQGLYAETRREAPAFWQRRHFFFIGSGRHRPNTDAALWFAHEIWPMIHEALPDVQFHVIGSYLPPEVEALNGSQNIVVDGFVEDLRPVLDSMRVGVSPLRFGAGIKGKVATMLGAGIPIVCTSMSVEGMEIATGNGVILAETPREIASACIDLYSSPSEWTRLSRLGMEHIAKHFGIAANDGAFAAMLWENRLLPPSAWLSDAAWPTFADLPKPDSRPDLSIIVECWSKSLELASRCIRALINHTSESSWELILASADEALAKQLAQAFPEMVIAADRRGTAVASRKALGMAKGKLVCLMHDCALVMRGWLDEMRQCLPGQEHVALGSAANAFDRTGRANGGNPDILLAARDYLRKLPRRYSLSPLVCRGFATSFGQAREICWTPTPVAIWQRRHNPVREPLTKSRTVAPRCQKRLNAIYLLPEQAGQIDVETAKNRCESLHGAGHDAEIVFDSSLLAGGFGIDKYCESSSGTFNAVICPAESICWDGVPEGVFRIADFAPDAWPQLNEAEKADLSASILSSTDLALAQNMTEKKRLDAINHQPDKIIHIPPAPEAAFEAPANGSLTSIAAILGNDRDLSFASAIIYAIHKYLCNKPAPFQLCVYGPHEDLAEAASPWEKRMLRLPWVDSSFAIPQYATADLILLVSQSPLLRAQSLAPGLPALDCWQANGRKRDSRDIGGDIFDMFLDPAALISAGVWARNEFMAILKARDLGLATLEKKFQYLSCR